MFADEARRIAEIARADTSFRRVPGQLVQAAERKLTATRTIDDFRLEAMRLMALAGNGHSRAIVNDTVSVVAQRFVWLGDGPHIVGGDLHGARLASVNGVAVPDIFAAMRPLLAGTDQRSRVLACFMLAWKPAIMLATGKDGPLSYTVRDTAGRVIEIAAGELVRGTDLYPVRDPGAAETLIAASGLAEMSEARTGVFLRWLVGGVPYVRIGDLSAAPCDVIAERLGSVGEQIAGGTRLVIDLRGNPGGDFRAAAAFARRLPEIMPDRVIAVLVDKFTFSAALVTAALLKVHAGARLIGEEMGDAARFHAEGGLETLPKSGIAVRYCDGWHDWAEGRADPELTPAPIARELVAAGSLLPDFPVPLTGRDFVAGNDAGLEAAMRLVTAGRT